MDRSCKYCKFIIFKTTTISKSHYGYCKNLKMNRIGLELNCKYFERMDK